MKNDITIDLNALRPTELADLVALLTASAKEDMDFNIEYNGVNHVPENKVMAAQQAELALIANVGVEDAVELMAIAGACPEILEINLLDLCL